MIERTLFSPDHEAFRDSFRRFMDKEIAPFHADWEEQGCVDREVWRKAGANGFLCMTMPEAYGGAGADKLYSVVQMEELGRAGFSGIGYGLHSEIVAPYLLHYGTEAQKAKYLPQLASGDMVGAIAMSEPAAGSDLQGIQSTALVQPDGSYRLNGSKTFITNGWHADLVIVVAKTNPAAGAKGTSLFLVERGMPGFEKGKRLKKLGLKAQDTSELFFDNVRVPVDHLLGGAAQLNRGFIGLMEQLPWERLQIAIGAVAAAQAAIDWTVAYVKERKVFGQPVAAYQNTRFTLAELQTEVQVARVFVDKCTELLVQGQLDTATASMAKYWCSDLQCKVMDECVQLFGGYGYMWE
ncbi:MAG: acyl-CoA dehydrogenase family protein, partial [Hydrogenophaga sp.]|nr:acyl-CoA dehydrogenase family protein [Hydrogenophaga sp.]